jgi:serine/threonine-protein kinase
LGTDLINQVLLNQYRVDAFIASGGMGTVYRVWDLKRNVPLAMKVIHADLADDPSMAKRFKREANALKKLAHPNIVPFYGLYQTAEFAFLLERYVDGPSLKDILRKSHRKTLPFDETLTYLKALSAALGYAHANGVVHCDVKPGNVMVDQGGNIYLTDFGIARHTESTTTTLVTTGTAAYMAPEQIRGEPVSPATDIYALGIILFEMLTGQRPFKAEGIAAESSGSNTVERIRLAQLLLPSPNPITINPTLNEDLVHVIMKAMEKEADKRYISTYDLFAAACKAMNCQAELLPDRITTSEPPVFQRVTREELDSSHHRHKRRGLISFFLILAGVLAIAVTMRISSRSDIHNLPSTAILTRESNHLSPTATYLLNSLTPQFAQYTNTVPPFTHTPIPTKVIPDPLNLSDPQSVLTWMNYAIENKDLAFFDVFIHTNEIFYVNNIEGGQTVPVSGYMNDLRLRTSSQPICIGTYLDEYYLQIWYSNWAPAWEMTEFCYDGCGPLDPPWNSTTAGFFFENIGGNYQLTKMFLNEPQNYFFQGDLPLIACSDGKSSLITVTPNPNCPGAPPQRLKVGERGKVCTQSDPVKLRTNPGRASSAISSLLTGTLFTVIGGPECGGDNWSWWQIRTDDGRTGWIAEGGDYVDPYFLCNLP